MKSCCKALCITFHVDSLSAPVRDNLVRPSRRWFRIFQRTRSRASVTAGPTWPYSGKGLNQHCAFNDVRYLWTDGSYTTNTNVGAPAWGWIGAGGDTYLIRDGPWRVGQSGPNSGDYLGLAGNPYGAGAPPPLSGTHAAHTRILGENYASCHAQSARTQLHGGYGSRISL